MIVKDADALVLVEVAIANDDIPVSADQANPMSSTTDGQTSQRGLHGAEQFDTVAIGMCPDDLKILDLGRIFVFPDLGTDGLRVCGSVVRTDDSNGRPWSSHHNPSTPFSRDVDGPHFGEVDFDWLRQRVSSRRKPKRPLGELCRLRILEFGVG